MTKHELTEYVKSAKDPVYFLNTYGYVYDITKKQIDRLTCFSYQEDMVKKFQKNQNNIVLKSRQLGLSVVTAGFVAWTLLFKIDQRILIVANDGAAAVRFLETVKQFLNYLPKFFYDPKKDDEINNQKYIGLRNGNWVKAVASGKQAGRGEALTMLILDEVAFIENADDIWMGAGLALTATKGKCIMISTPFGTGNLYHRTWVAAEKQEGSSFVPTTIHWTEHPVYSVGKELRKDEFGRQYWWSPWYEHECERFNFDRIKIAQELDLSFEGSKALVIESHIIAKYRQDILVKGEPVCYYDHTISENCFVNNVRTNFWVWEKPLDGHNYIVSCLPEGEFVLTNSGLKKIENITFKDKLIDKEGNYTSIKNIQVTPEYNGFVYDFKLSNVFRRTSFTGNHPILSSCNTILKRNYNKKHEKLKFNERYWEFNFKYNNADDLSVGDWLVFPNLYKKNTITHNEIKNHWEKYKNGNRVDFTIDCPLLDEDFWWFIGMWLAEGWTYKNEYSKTIYTVHNIKTEKHYADKIKKLFEKYNRKVTTTDKGPVIMCQFNSTQLFDFINDNFGKYALNKKLPEWVKHLPDEFKLQLVKGYLDGDGCQFVSRNELKSTYVSISLKLLEGVQDILFSLGIISVLKKLRSAGKTTILNKTFKTKETYELNIGHYDSIKLLNKLKIKHDYTFKNKRIIKDCFLSKNEEEIYFRIKDINKKYYSGIVYNFETEAHSFLCKNITTHNCDVGRGDGSDYSTIQVIDANELKQVAEYQGKIPPDLFAHLIHKVALEYNKAYVVIECNSFGLATCLVLKNQLRYDSARIYHSKSIKKMVNHHWNVDVDENGEIPGFQTTTTTRPLIIASLTAYLRDRKIELNSKRLVTEFDTFIYNGVKPEHSSGYHDDLIIALAIGLYIRDTQFQNVFISKDFYKSMLDSFSHSTSENKYDVNKPKAPGVYDSGDKRVDDDLSWLLS